MTAQAQTPDAVNWVAALRGFVDARDTPIERCELCHAIVGDRHSHLIEPGNRRLLCACPACALLFSEGQGRRYRRVPTTVTRLVDFQLPDAQWDDLLIPIGLAFFFRSSAASRVIAMYPGPAGATESTLDLAAWDALVAANPVLGQMEDDAEALLVDRIDGSRDCYLVPIDRCFELVGRIRRHWHGISGGQQAREAIRAFFSGLRAQAIDARVPADA
ncbi:MAG: DUF5947 family protein [Pseudomonadota bacterium]|nr:DUF5947 family protein [Pseudomonadota bacterium]